ncbi:MAG: flavodoxin family protein [Candidatus Thorarchaeota archaeon]
MKVVAVNGSPRMEKGRTTSILTPFLEGLKKGGASVQHHYLHKMKIRPCIGELKCWRETPGECFYRDDMHEIYEVLRESDVLVIATPVYVPLPGAMQEFLNRMVPLMQPSLENREGRTRAKMRENVKLSKFVLISTSGWWELGNFDRTVHIIKEFAATSSIEYAGAILRPHARMMLQLPDEAQEIFDAARKAGHQFATNGSMSPETLQSISKPLISEEEYWAKR